MISVGFIIAATGGILLILVALACAYNLFIISIDRPDDLFEKIYLTGIVLVALGYVLMVFRI